MESPSYTSTRFLALYIRCGYYDSSLLPEHPIILPSFHKDHGLCVSDGVSPSANCRSCRAGYAQYSWNADLTADVYAENIMHSLLKFIAKEVPASLRVLYHKRSLRAHFDRSSQTIISCQLPKPISFCNTTQFPLINSHTDLNPQIVNPKHRSPLWSTLKSLKWKSQSTTSSRLLLPRTILIHHPNTPFKALPSQS